LENGVRARRLRILGGGTRGAVGAVEQLQQLLGGREGSLFQADDLTQG